MNNNYYQCGSCGSGASEWCVFQGLPVISWDQQKSMFNVRGNAGYHSRMVTFLSLFIYKKTPTKQAFSAHNHILLLMHKREMKMQDNDKEKTRKSREKERRKECKKRNKEKRNKKSKKAINIEMSKKLPEKAVFRIWRMTFAQTPDVTK